MRKFQTWLGDRYLMYSCKHYPRTNATKFHWKLVSTGPDKWLKNVRLQIITSQYMNQCFPRLPTPYDVNRPQWIEISFKWCKLYLRYRSIHVFAHDRHTGFVGGACATFDIFAMNSMVAYFPSKFNYEWFFRGISPCPIFIVCVIHIEIFRFSFPTKHVIPLWKSCASCYLMISECYKSQHNSILASSKHSI